MSASGRAPRSLLPLVALLCACGVKGPPRAPGAETPPSEFSRDCKDHCADQPQAPNPSDAPARLEGVGGDTEPIR